ncbi:protein-tyrosine phosphatase family protein [Nocardia stercoris]|uniref:protein-tyrosine phosphatase family protein n=1 Tax=Nocardia stercoris TaxID=2483361 RepID=UPI0018F279E9|nr:dual specificity protein phosphatase family protein [Nocardia stercoris]
MSTWTSGPGVPFAETGWDEIASGLWMGGHQRKGTGGGLVPVLVGSEFDVVISLYQQAGHGPAPEVEHHVALMPDGPLTTRQIDRVRELAGIAATAIHGGRRVLVRCYAGYNRSGLVAGQTLIQLGHTPKDAIDRIRARRSPWALHNRLFVDYLTSGLDLARLLTDLRD